MLNFRAALLLLLVFEVPFARAMSCAEIMDADSLSKHQAAFVGVLTRAGLDERHRVLFDTTYQMSSPGTRILRLPAEAPFEVLQRDYREDAEWGGGRPEIVVRPVREGALSLRLTMGLADILKRPVDDLLRVRRQMAQGDFSAIAQDPLVRVYFNLKCEPSPAMATWVAGARWGRGLRLSLASESALLEELGAFEVLAQMQRRREGQSFRLAPPNLSLVPGGLDVSIWGTLTPIASHPITDLSMHLSFYQHLYDTVSARAPGMLKLETPAQERTSTVGHEEIRRAFEEAPPMWTRQPTVETFELRCPFGTLTAEGYQNPFGAAMEALQPPPVTEPAPPRVVEKPVVEKPVVETKPAAAPVVEESAVVEKPTAKPAAPRVTEPGPPPVTEPAPPPVAEPAPPPVAEPAPPPVTESAPPPVTEPAPPPVAEPAPPPAAEPAPVVKTRSVSEAKPKRTPRKKPAPRRGRKRNPPAAPDKPKTE